MKIFPKFTCSILLPFLGVTSLGLAGCQQNSTPKVLRLQGQIVGQEIVVSAKATGKIESVGAYAGDRVTPGQVLLRFDDAPLQQKLLAIQQQGATAEQEAMQLRAQQQTLRQQLQQSLLVSAPMVPDAVSGDALGEQLRSQLQVAETELKQAQDARNRIIPLVQQGALPRKQLEEAEIRVQRAKDLVKQTTSAIELAKTRPSSMPQAATAIPQNADQFKEAIAQAQVQEKSAVQKMALLRKQLQGTQKQLTQLSLLSPFEGRVMQQMADTGSMIKPGQPLLKLLKSDTLRWVGTVPGNQANLLLIGQVARLSLQGHPQGGVKASILEVRSPSPGSTAMPVQVSMKLEEDDMGLAKPGTAVEAEIQPGSSSGGKP
jgi:multidrug resistance efflux pump